MEQCHKNPTQLSSQATDKLNQYPESESVFSKQYKCSEWKGLLFILATAQRNQKGNSKWAENPKRSSHKSLYTQVITHQENLLS